MNKFLKRNSTILAASAAYGVGLTFVILGVISALVRPETLLAQVGPTAVWVTANGCGDRSEARDEFDVGDQVYINGLGFPPGEKYSWVIDRNGADTVARGSIMPESDSSFCAEAYRIQDGDSGDYAVQVGEARSAFTVNPAAASTATPADPVEPTGTRPAADTATVASTSTPLPANSPVPDASSTPTPALPVPTDSPSAPAPPTNTATQVPQSPPTETATEVPASTATSASEARSRAIVQQTPEPVTSAWSYSCGSGVEVEIIGAGMGTRFESINPQSITVDNVGNISQIIVQVVTRNYTARSIPPPDEVIISSPLETFVVQDPVLGEGYELGGHNWEATLQPTNVITAQVIGAGSGNRLTPRSVEAFVFRNTGAPSAATGELLRFGVYQDSYSKSFAIPTATAPRDVKIDFAITDMAEDGRIVVFSAEAGGVTGAITEAADNRGKELLIDTLILPNVPGGASSITVTLTSPVANGDSVYLSGLNVTTPCLQGPTPTPTATGTVPVPPPTNTPTPTGTAPVVPPTNTPTPTGTVPVVPPTNTPTATATGTAPVVPPTNTPTATPTGTVPVVPPTNTPTATATGTVPVVPPTNTPTATPRDSSRPPPPAATETPTPVPTSPPPTVLPSPTPTPVFLLPVTGDNSPARLDQTPRMLVTVGFLFLGVGLALHGMSRKRRREK